MGIVYKTVGDIITASLQELAILRPSERPTPAQLQVGVNRFNLLLDELSIGLANLFVEQSDSFALSAGVNPYSIGVGQTWNTPTPIKIDQAFLTIANTNYPIDTGMTEDEYYDLPQPTDQTQPTRLWFQSLGITGNVFFDYVPDQNYAFTMLSFKALAKATDGNTLLAYPDGYEAMLVYNLAARSGASFGKQPSAITMALAGSTLSAVQNLNASRLIRPADFGDVPGRRSYGFGGEIYNMGMD